MCCRQPEPGLGPTHTKKLIVNCSCATGVGFVVYASNSSAVGVKEGVSVGVKLGDALLMTDSVRFFVALGAGTLVSVYGTFVSVAVSCGGAVKVMVVFGDPVAVTLRVGRGAVGVLVSLVKVPVT